MIGPIATGYLILALTVWAISAIKRDTVGELLARVMLLSWSASNLSVVFAGFHGFPAIVPAIDGLLGIAVAVIAVNERRRAAFIVFALFVCEELSHVTFIFIHEAPSLWYIVTLNAIFAAQVLTVGVSSVRTRMVDRDARFGRGADYHAQGRTRSVVVASKRRAF